MAFKNLKKLSQKSCRSPVGDFRSGAFFGQKIALGNKAARSGSHELAKVLRYCLIALLARLGVGARWTVQAL
jgi:hypothetical protein